MTVTPQEREEARRATDKARLELKPGDRLQVTRCGGGLINVTMTGWDGDWICSRKYADIGARSIRKVNGRPTSFVTPNPMCRDRLPMWVIYDHPTDLPDWFVARMHHALPESTPTDEVAVANDLETLRRRFYDAGYHCLGRMPKDDPKIVEVWIV